MKMNISTRLKIFLIAVCIIVAGQMYYSIRNVETFQNGYLETLQEKSRKLGGFLRDDVEYVLNLGIPVTKLIKLENTLKEILLAIPELAFIEITDLRRNVLYYADHTSMGRVKTEQRRSATMDADAEEILRENGLAPEDVDVVIPFFHRKKNQKVGFIIMRLSPSLIVGKSKEILLDMITVILTSLLITFELLTFFVSYSISAPLEVMVSEVRKAVGHPEYLDLDPNTRSMNEVSDLIRKFNGFINKMSRQFFPFVTVRWFFPETRMEMDKSLDIQIKHLDTVLKRAGETNHPASHLGEYEKAELSKIRRQLKRLKVHLNGLSGFIKRKNLPADSTEAGMPGIAPPAESKIPYAHIRPIIFIFIMADALCISFFPMFVDTLYQPFAGLSREVAIGLPISVFMLSLAFSLPISGIVCDMYGMYQVLIVGVSINAAGFFLTAFSDSFVQLILFRSLTAAGFGMVFMASQRFIVEKTDVQNRSRGMASFLAAFFSGDICGTVIGGMLANRIGYHNVFLVSGLISMISGICCLAIFGVDRFRVNEKPAVRMYPFEGLFQALKDREFLAIVFLQAIPAKLILIGFLFYFVPLYLKEIGTLQSNIGRVIMCYAVMLVFAGPLFSKYFDRPEHRKRNIAIGGILSGASMVSFYFFTGFWPVAFIVIMMGIAHTFSVSSLASLVSESSVVKMIGMGVGLGAFRFWERTGNVAGPLLMGAISARAGFEHAVIYLGLFSILCSLIFLLVLRTRHTPTES